MTKTELSFGLLRSGESYLDAQAAAAAAIDLGYSVDRIRHRLSVVGKFSRGSATCRMSVIINLQGKQYEIDATHGLKSDYVVVEEKVIPFNVSDYYAIKPFSTKVCGQELTIARAMVLVRELERQSVDVSLSAVASASSECQVTSSILEPKLGADIRLFDYQQSGVDWIFDRGSRGMGGLLADEMGLGKTVQAIAWISAVAHTEMPVLVVTPAALTENWRRELRKFAGIESLVYEGTARSLSPELLVKERVVIATYDSVRTNELVLQGIMWHTIVLDEAQYIKNHLAARTKACKALTKSVGIALTGTPVENHPSELVSILDFIVPGAFDDLLQLGREIPDSLVDERIRPILPSLLLRREVKDVAQDLPRRIDSHLPLVPSIQYLQAQEQLVAEMASASNFGQRLALITKLRLLSGSEDPDVSAKFRFLDETIETAIVSNRKVLVFASFNESINKISKHIDDSGVWVGKITGAIDGPARQDLIDEFSTIQGPAFLVLNPKAGGVGLNITEASVVVHFEPEWNPALVDQATARAHRRGQLNSVFVYYLSYVNSIEEWIEVLLETKRQVAGDLISPTEASLDDNEISKIFAWLHSRGESI